MHGRNQHSTEWTPEQDEFVRQNYRIISTREIGAKLGFSKNAVIGRAHRIGLGKPYAEVFNTGTKFGTKPKGTVRQRINVVKRATDFARDKYDQIPRMKRQPLPALNNSIPPLNGVGVSIWDLSQKSCRWMLGEPKELKFCGHEHRPGSSYCEDHHNWTVNRK